MDTIQISVVEESKWVNIDNPNRKLISIEFVRSDAGNDTYEGSDESKSRDNIAFKYLSDFKLVIEYSIPSILTLFSLNGIIFMNTVFIGLKNDSTSLAAWGLGFVTLNIASISFADGMDSLVAQTYGRKDYYSCEIYLPRIPWINSSLIIKWFIKMWNKIWRTSIYFNLMIILE